MFFEASKLLGGFSIRNFGSWRCKSVSVFIFKFVDFVRFLEMGWRYEAGLFLIISVVVIWVCATSSPIQFLYSIYHGKRLIFAVNFAANS